MVSRLSELNREIIEAVPEPVHGFSRIPEIARMTRKKYASKKASPTKRAGRPRSGSDTKLQSNHRDTKKVTEILTR
jgi:hypothetical protein